MAEQKKCALAETKSILAARTSITFDALAVMLMESFMLRETNVKDICLELAVAGVIDNTWGGGNRKPKGQDILRLARGRTQ